MEKQERLAERQAEMKMQSDMELKQRKLELVEKQRQREEIKQNNDKLQEDKVSELLNRREESDMVRANADVHKKLERDKIKQERLLKRADREETVSRIGRMQE